MAATRAGGLPRPRVSPDETPRYGVAGPRRGPVRGERSAGRGSAAAVVGASWPRMPVLPASAWRRAARAGGAAAGFSSWVVSCAGLARGAALSCRVLSRLAVRSARRAADFRSESAPAAGRGVSSRLGVGITAVLRAGYAGGRASRMPIPTHRFTTSATRWSGVACGRRASGIVRSARPARADCTTAVVRPKGNLRPAAFSPSGTDLATGLPPDSDARR